MKWTVGGINHVSDGGVLLTTRQQSSSGVTATDLSSVDQTTGLPMGRRTSAFGAGCVGEGCPAPRCHLSFQQGAGWCLGRALNLGSEDGPCVHLQGFLSSQHEPIGIVLELPPTHRAILGKFSEHPRPSFPLLKTDP